MTRWVSDNGAELAIVDGHYRATIDLGEGVTLETSLAPVEEHRWVSATGRTSEGSRRLDIVALAKRDRHTFVLRHRTFDPFTDEAIEPPHEHVLWPVVEETAR